MARTKGRVLGAATAAVLLAAGAAAAVEIEGMAVVRSGSEIAIDGKSVRLYGVKVPAPDARCDSGEGEFQCGVVAWAELILLADGKPLSCDVEGEAPQGAFVGTCYVGERDVNEALVRSGWAEAAADTDRYRVDQEDARSARRGMWAARVRPPDRRQAP